MKTADEEEESPSVIPTSFLQKTLLVFVVPFMLISHRLSSVINFFTERGFCSDQSLQSRFPLGSTTCDSTFFSELSPPVSSYFLLSSP